MHPFHVNRQRKNSDLAGAVKIAERPLIVYFQQDDDSAKSLPTQAADWPISGLAEFSPLLLASSDLGWNSPCGLIRPSLGTSPNSR